MGQKKEISTKLVFNFLFFTSMGVNFTLFMFTHIFSSKKKGAFKVNLGVMTQISRF